MNAFEGLTEFAAVVEQGTFTAAARQLGVSVSHVSRQVAELEARLVAQLFVRTTRQMRLTEAGQRLFDTCQPLMQELQHAQASVLAAHEAVEGHIRISLAGKFAEEQLLPLLTEFAHAYPGIALDVDLSARNVDLIGEGFHLAVRMGPLESSSALVTTLLLTVPLRALASPRLLAGLPPIHTPADLPSALCLPLVKRQWDFVKGKKRFTVLPVGRFASNSGAAVIQAARAGLGIVHVPAYYADKVGSDGSLSHILADWGSVDASSFHIVFPAGRHMPLRVRRLIDHLQAGVAHYKAD